MIITRKKAKEKGLIFYFTGKPCKHGHKCKRYVTKGHCCACHKNQMSIWWSKNREWDRARYRTNKEHRERKAVRFKEYYELNKEKRYEYKKKWLENHPQYIEQWYRDNPEKHKEYYENHRNSATGKLRMFCRGTTQRLCVGKLANRDVELLAYSAEEFSSYLLKNTKFNSFKEVFDANYHIDHIVPVSYVARNINNGTLQFQVVMDLENLRLIPAEENLSKNGKINLPEVQSMIKYLGKK